jgi:hypothetical protein
MLLTEYAKNVSEFPIDSLKVYGVVMGLLGVERERREGMRSSVIKKLGGV